MTASSSDASMVERLRGWARGIKRDVHALYFVGARSARALVRQGGGARRRRLRAVADRPDPGLHSGARLPRRSDHRAARHPAGGAADPGRQSSPSIAPRRARRGTPRRAAAQPSVIIAIWIGLALVATRLRHPLFRGRQHKEASMQHFAVAAVGAALALAAAFVSSRAVVTAHAPAPKACAMPTPTGARGGDVRRRLLLVDGVRIRQGRPASRRPCPASWAARRRTQPMSRSPQATPAMPRACRSPTIRRSSAIRSSSTTTGVTSTCSTAAGSSATAADEYRPVIFAHTPEQTQAAADEQGETRREPALLARRSR